MPIPSSNHARSQVAKWQVLKKHLSNWYAEPDYQCLRACAALYLSHYSNESPIWAFILGPPSTGKTELMINPLTSLPLATIVSSITESAFISNYNEKAGILPSLPLHNGQKSGILLFPDFSNFLALDSKIRTNLQAQLREIYDGSYRKHCGIRAKPIEWNGKISILAACTMELERYWGLENALGDRFLNIKLKPPTQFDSEQYFHRQLEYGKSKIIAETKKLYLNWINDTDKSPDCAIPSKEKIKEIGNLVDICLSLRKSVTRDSTGGISGVSAKDGPARFIFMLINLARHHAKLFGLTEFSKLEYDLIHRVTLDTCPSRRLKACRILLSTTQMLTSKEFTLSMSDSAGNKTMYRLIEELEAIGVIVSQWQGKIKYITLDPDFREQMIRANIEPILANLDTTLDD